MNKDLDYIAREKNSKRVELEKQIGINTIPADERKKMSHKEKYGKCNSVGKRSGFNPFQFGFFDVVPKRTPAGFNVALGYCEEVVE
jgi:hypothetical protein